jgi:hypothetical protein
LASRGRLFALASRGAAFVSSIEDSLLPAVASGKLARTRD